MNGNLRYIKNKLQVPQLDPTYRLEKKWKQYSDGCRAFITHSRRGIITLGVQKTLAFPWHSRVYTAFKTATSTCHGGISRVPGPFFVELVVNRTVWHALHMHPIGNHVVGFLENLLVHL